MPGIVASEESSPLSEMVSGPTQPTEQPKDIATSSAEPVLETVIPPQAVNPDTQVESISRLPEEDVSEEGKIIPDVAHQNADAELQPDEVTNKVEPIAANDNDKVPQRYRPPSQTAPRQQRTRTPVQPATRNGQSEVLLDIRLRLTFDRFGFCRLALLPERKGQLDDEIIVRHEGVFLGLTAQEDWYQDLEFANIGNLFA